MKKLSSIPRELVGQVAVLVAVNFVAISSMYFFIPTLETFADWFGVSTGMAGAISWVNTLGYGVANIFLGYFLSKQGFRRTFFGGFALLILSSLFMANTKSFYPFVALRFVGGFGAGLIIPTSWAFVFKNFPPSAQGWAVSLLSLDLMISYMVGLPLGASFVINNGIPFCFYLLAAICILSIFMLAAIPQPDCENKAQHFSVREHLRKLGSFLKDSSARSYVVTIFLWSFGYHAVFNYLGTWVSQQTNLVNSEGSFFFIFGLAASIGCLCATMLSRFRHLVGGIMLAILSICFAAWGSMGVSIWVGAISLWLFFDRLAFTHFFSLTSKSTSGDVANYTTLVLMSLLLSSSSSTAISGFFLDTYDSIGLVLGGFYIISMVAALILVWCSLSHLIWRKSSE